jgi:hypothetical protein
MNLQLQRLSPSVKPSAKGRMSSYFRVFICAESRILSELFNIIGVKRKY